MPIREVNAKEYQCDGCGSTVVVDADDGMPLGHSVRWFSVEGGGGEGGDLWVCKDACLTKAWKRRYDINRGD